MTDHSQGPTGQGGDAPNPYSREGGAAGEQHGTESGQASGATALPPSGGSQPGGSQPGGTDPYTYQPPSQPAQPYGQPSANPPYEQPYGQQGGQPYSQPSANPPYGQAADPYGQQGGQPSANPPYGQPSANPPYEQPPGYDQSGGYGSTGYDQQAAGYGQPAPGQAGNGQTSYGQPGGDQSAYGVTPYQSGYGYPGYGAGAVQHPQAVVALVTGIIGTVLCGPVGIAGIINGRKVRNEIDADPQRYTGRGMGTAGLILGIVGLVVTVLWVLLIVIGYASSN